MDCNGVLQTVTIIAGGIALIAAVLGLINCISGDCGSVTINIAPSPTPTPTRTQTLTPTPTRTQTLTPTPTLTPSTSYTPGIPRISFSYTINDLTYNNPYTYNSYNVYLSWDDGLGNSGQTISQNLTLKMYT
jgi:hypothetical protein